LDPAVVTRLVADLERHLGAPLLQRTTRRVSLTPAGEDYVARIRSILDDIDKADASVHQQAGALRGRLRILSLASIASNILAPGLKDFLAKYPDIQVDIRTTYGADPALEDYDLTFVGAYASVPADVVTRKVTAAVMALWASPEYLDRHGVPDAPQDLAQHRVILLRRGGGTPERLRLLHAEHGDSEEVVDIDPTLVCEDVLTVLRTTLDGVGISSMSACHHCALRQGRDTASGAALVDHESHPGAGCVSKPQITCAPRPCLSGPHPCVCRSQAPARLRRSPAGSQHH
jgi:DNA-binding transcriptional LysR family regulator